MSIPDVQTLAIAIVVGLALGCVYALVAISFNLVLSACGVFNLTISGVITVGVIASYLLGTKLGWPAPLVVVTVMAFGGLVGLLAEVLAVRRVLAMRPKDVAHDTMVSTLGLGMALNALAAILFGTNIFPVDSYVSATPIVVAEVSIRPVYLVMPVVVVAVAIIIEMVLRKTEIGLVTRAVISSNEGASLVGISVNRVVQGAFLASGLMAGLGAFLIAPVVSASPFVGESIMLLGFASIAIGGFASFRGAILGGLIVGLIVGVSPAFLNEPSLKHPLVWATMIIVLFVKPAGLFGKGGQFGATAVREV